MGLFSRQIVTAVVVAVTTGSGLVGCTSQDDNETGSAEQTAEVTNEQPSDESSGDPAAEGNEWALSVDVPVNGPVSWEENLSDDWRFEGEAGPSSVYINGLCRLTLQEGLEAKGAGNDADATQALVNSMNEYLEEVPQISDIEIAETRSSWLPVDGVSTEFQSQEFTYTMEGTDGDQTWSAVYLARAFSTGETGMAAQAECQSVPLTDTYQDTIETALDSLTANID